ncbi:hypothetical protein P872_03025 [Rhodonellum psychrophilum GCM71 = DSM 17998]|uniref:Uncharacterized protein n=1 Tax=Rhodonellum psychrophilum GCM71 = DSM 17998 TaxID=1123057 RepID=U5C0F6_9BACT|nr:hypothetical protein P872_03025 [Rhodonellum psychrophilum GCM71 = DSM 17998]
MARIMTDQKPKKKLAPGNRLYFRKRIQPAAVDSIFPAIKGKKLSALSITNEILKESSFTTPLNRWLFFFVSSKSRKFTFWVT